MRSVVIHLIATSHDAVRAQLAQFAKPDGDRWFYPIHASQPALYIEFYEQFEREFEPEELLPLKSVLGRMPDVTVIANVSGRVPGNTEILEFAEHLLGVFRGVACDEYSHHCWSLSEIRTGAEHHGLKFFDYEGWHRNKSSS